MGRGLAGVQGGQLEVLFPHTEAIIPPALAVVWGIGNRG